VVGIAIIPLLILLMLLAASALAVWRGITLPRGVQGTPACGGCGYAVADLTTFTCPECGGDLREIGISTPSNEAKRRGSLAGALLGWTFLCFIGGYVAIQVIAMTGIFTSPSTPSRTLYDWSQGLTPESGAFRSFAVTVSADTTKHVQPIEIELVTVDGRKHTLSLDTDAMELSGKELHPVAWASDELTAWFDDAGVPSEDPAVAAEVAELGGFLDTIAHTPGRNPTGQLRHFGSHHVWNTQATAGPIGYAPNRFAMGAAYLGVLAVYILGIVWIVLRRRRMLRTSGV
jgi:hypothetical protein